MLSKLKALLLLSRVSNLPTVWTNVMAGCLLTYHGGGVAWAPLILGASLLYAGGMVLNDVADRKWDRDHRPERPIPSGVISVPAASSFALALLLGGAALMRVGGVELAWLGLLLFAIVLYDFCHKQWVGSVWVMGACRSLLVIAASSAVAGWGFPRPIVLLWATALGLYTVGITLAARGEANDSKVGKFGQVLLGMPITAAVFHFLRIYIPSTAGWVIFGLFVIWGIMCVRCLEGRSEGRISRAVGLLIAGMVLIDAMAVSFLFPGIGLWMLLGLPLTLFLQRFVPGT